MNNISSKAHNKVIISSAVQRSSKGERGFPFQKHFKIVLFSVNPNATDLENFHNDSLYN